MSILFTISKNERIIELSGSTSLSEFWKFNIIGAIEMTKKLDSNNVMSGTRKATKEEIDNAMLLLTGTRSKVSSEVEISIPAMDTAFDIFCEGIRKVDTIKTGLVKAFSLAFEECFGGKEWYKLEKQGKLGAGVRAYHKKVTAFYVSIGAVNPDQKWAKIKEASGYRTEGQVKKEADNVAKQEAVKVEASKNSDQKICGYLTSIINLINNADTTIKATPFLGQFQSAFYSIGGKMFK